MELKAESMKGKTLTDERFILGFIGSEKVGGITYKVFLLVITARIADFEVSKILISKGSSCRIMYSKYFEKLGLKMERI